MLQKYSSNSKGRKEKQRRTKRTTKKPNKMLDTYVNIPKTTLNVSGLNSPIRNKDCQAGLKNTSQLHTVYKKLTLQTG